MDKGLVISQRESLIMRDNKALVISRLETLHTVLVCNQSQRTPLSGDINQHYIVLYYS